MLLININIPLFTESQHQAEIRAITECVNWMQVDIASTGHNIFTDIWKIIWAISADKVKSKTVLVCKKALSENSPKGKVYITWVSWATSGWWPTKRNFYIEFYLNSKVFKQFIDKKQNFLSEALYRSIGQTWVDPRENIDCLRLVYFKLVVFEPVFLALV
ncbi:hypothetical protein FF38_06806 [Lucilia cuprina]|uniref:Uncharacterized protein n=1 Tax=Lucilia cuprina TaxID=7375 RepID=A0A0L0C701_LUCCU|nr:hypothetical protein FF38_06806 [Lucilia cuprina]